MENKENKEKLNLVSGLFLKKPYEALKYMYKEKEYLYPSKVAKVIDCTYSHVIKLLNNFEKLGIIVSKKEGRVREIKLTVRGENLCKSLFKAIEECEIKSLE